MNDGDATEVHLAHGGRERRVLVHAPAGVGQAGPAPLVLAFHGGLGTAKAMRRQSLLDRVADRERFIVAYPEGIGRFRDRMLTWNAGSCCGYAMRMNSDDVGFTLAILDEVARRWSVDAARTYAVGFSNGGMFSYRLACEVPERFAAVGVVSATLTVDGPEPRLPTPVIHVHGLADRNVSFEGGIGENQFSRTDYRPVEETLAWWVRVNHCDPRPVESRDEGECNVRRYAPREGRAGAPVELVTLPAGGHTWPGGIDISEHLGTGRLVENVDASARIWSFLSRFHR